MVPKTLVHRAALAGALLVSLVGVQAARAMPVSSTLPALAAPGPTDVYYRSYRDRPYNRHRHAGLYNCGPGALNTHLERQACGYSRRGHNGRYR